MKSSEDLFYLIKSLTKSEKRNFKLFASKYKYSWKLNVYLKLFDSIDSRSFYSEAEIRKEFQGEKFLNQLHVVKNYLYNLILRSLVLEHADSQVDASLRNLMHQIEILYEKGLFDQARKILVRRKDMAKKNERFLQVLECITWEDKLMRTESFLYQTEESLDNKHREEDLNFRYMMREALFRRLDSRMLLLAMKEEGIRDEERRIKSGEILSHPLLRSEDEARNSQEKAYLLDCYATYYLVTGDREKSLLYRGKMLSFLEKDPDYLYEKPLSYISVLHNMLNLLSEYKRSREFFPLLEKLRSFVLRPDLRLSESVRVSSLIRTYNLELFNYQNEGAFDKCIERIREIEPLIKKHKIIISQVTGMVLYFNFAYSYFALGEFSRARLWLKKLLDMGEPDLRMDIYNVSRIFNLILHLELGNTDVLEYEVRSAYRYMSKKKRLNKYEAIMLDFIRRKVPRFRTQDDKVHAFTELKEALAKISEDPYERVMFDTFDIFSWIESKITGKPFREVIKRHIE